MEDKINSDTILNHLKSLVESKQQIPREEWLNASFRLMSLRIDEAQLLNRMRRELAEKKMAIFKAQEKRNVAAAEVEIEASEAYLFMRDQEEKLYSIDELVRIAKKAADNF